MLTSNTMRFGTDTFGDALTFVDPPITPTEPDPDTPSESQEGFQKTALLISKKALDCTKKSNVDSFVIYGNEPEGSERRIIFKIDGALYYFKNGSLASYTRDGEFDDIIKYGNKVSTLNGLSNITGFVGKKIYPIIALRAPSDADNFPTIKIGLATRTNDDQLTYTVESDVYEISKEPETITDITAQTVVTGNAEVDIKVKLINQGVESSYMSLAQAADEEADSVQFKIKYTVSTADGSEKAQVKSITVSHSSGQSIVKDTNANLYSKVQSYGTDLQTAYVVVRHEPLIDSKIEAYVNFMPEPKHKELVSLGTATGGRQEKSLGESNIVPTSIQLYQNDQPLYDFDFSTALGTVIFNAKSGSTIYASFDYDYGMEEWLKMTAEEPQPYNDDDGTYSTRFTYTTDNPTDMKIANVRIKITRNTGTVSSESLGKATGKTQLFVLKHSARASTIKLYQDGQEFDNFSYDEDSGILTVSASKGKALTANYSWKGKPVVIRSFAAGFSPV